MSEYPSNSGESSAGAMVRWRWLIRGQVQGVGFRPFVYRVAQQAGVTGYVLNDPTGVVLEVQGTPEALARFRRGFAAQLPPLARIDHVDEQTIAVVADERAFRIAHSQAAGAVEASVTIDSAVCPDCLREMFDPADRRFGHGLINCTNCGPRFSIIRDVPYDRCNTTMAGFAMCPDCRAEYENPADRRFHAQPVCCPRCGPRVELVDVVQAPCSDAASRRASEPTSARSVAGDPFEQAARRLHAGQIVAIKGLGGFHLAVRADDAAAVGRLRSLKRRDTKPFALMCKDVAMVKEIVDLSAAGEKELVSPRAPIVLAPRRAAACVVESVAPGTHRLGVMLPYTPMQHLLWAQLEKLCQAEGKPLPPLVMTSGNLSDEPLVTDNAEALERLGPLCDALLWHDRPIERCVDDTVILDRGAAESPLPLRRSRGYVPEPWLIGEHLRRAAVAPGKPGAINAGTGICLGGELKNTIAIVTHHEIILSQHFGDLTNAVAYQHFQKAIDDLIRLYEVRIDFVGHDLHPQYMSTTEAQRLAQRHGARLIGIQHHHAHAAAVLAEHGITQPALAIVCDGTGYGTDGTIWGGELLLVDGADCKRLGRLRPIRLPGGDAAARDTRRPALSLLHLAYGDGFDELPIARELISNDMERRTIATLIRRGFNSPWTSSTGRVFDGVAAILGLCLRNDHEAQAGMTLEGAAAQATAPPSTQPLFDIVHNPQAQLWEIDFSRLVRFLVENGPSPDQIPNTAWLFHDQLAWAFAALAQRAAADMQVTALGCSGGVLCNEVFARCLADRAGSTPYRTFFHKSYPPTDAGLAFGQAIVCLRN